MHTVQRWGCRKDTFIFVPSGCITLRESFVFIIHVIVLVKISSSFFTRICNIVRPVLFLFIKDCIFITDQRSLTRWFPQESCVFPLFFSKICSIIVHYCILTTHRFFYCHTKYISQIYIQKVHKIIMFVRFFYFMFSVSFFLSLFFLLSDEILILSLPVTILKSRFT